MYHDGNLFVQAPGADFELDAILPLILLSKMIRPLELSSNSLSIQSPLYEEPPLSFVFSNINWQIRNINFGIKALNNKWPYLFEHK